MLNSSKSILPVTIMTNPTKKTVRLIYQNDSHRGPGAVVQNLKSGLSKIDIETLSSFEPGEEDYVGFLQPVHPNLIKKYAESNKPVLMGPNLFVLPTEIPQLCNMFDNFVVPSAWVKEKYKEFDLMKNKNIHIWPVGIDTEKWAPFRSNNINEELDCFIYYKNRSPRDLALTEALCRKFKLKYKVLKYGSYKEEELYNLCQTIQTNGGFIILLTGTESQGIAYMQMLSFDIPCYVLNNPTWKSEDGLHEAAATSVPYFTKKCGEVVHDINIKNFERFLSQVKDRVYSPRDYILDNHTLEKSAENYIKIFELAK